MMPRVIQGSLIILFAGILIVLFGVTVSMILVSFSMRSE